MQTHSDMQNIYSIGAHSTLSLPAASVQGQYSTLGAPSCCTGSSLMRSVVSERAPRDRANCPLSIGHAINDSGAGYGAFLNREDTLDDPASCPEPLSQSQPDLLSRPILIDRAFAHSTGLRESPFDANDAGRENSNFYASFPPTTSPFCHRSSYGTECTIYLSRSFGADVPEQSNMNLHRAAAPIIPNSRVLSTELVREADDGRSSMGFDSCFKLELLPQLSAKDNCLKSANEQPTYLVSTSMRTADSSGSSGQEWVCERNSDDTWSEPAPLEYLGDSSLKDFSHLSPLVDRSEELTSEAPVPGAGRNSSRACKLCGTSKTPLWRSGPHGPKSLCNACGIRYKKSRRSQAANECPDQGVSPSSTPISMKLPARPLKRKLGSAGEEVGVKNRAKNPLKRSRWPALMVVKRDSRTTAEDMESCLTSPETFCSSRMSQMATLNRKAADAKLALLVNQSRLTRVFAKDEEEAAILLMALSCGLVLA